MKILLIIGHNAKSKGAYNTKLRISEFDFWKGYVEERISNWHHISRHQFSIVTRPHKGSPTYNEQMRHVHTIGKKWGADISVEFHFNGAMRVVKGHEVLYYRGSKGGRHIANIADKAFDKHLVNRDRGIKPRGVHDNGGYGLYVGEYPSILFEPFFNKQLVDYVKGGKYRKNLNEAFDQFFREVSL